MEGVTVASPRISTRVIAAALGLAAISCMAFCAGSRWNVTAGQGPNPLAVAEVHDQTIALQAYHESLEFVTEAIAMWQRHEQSDGWRSQHAQNCLEHLRRQLRD